MTIRRAHGAVVAGIVAVVAAAGAANGQSSSTITQNGKTTTQEVEASQVHRRRDGPAQATAPAPKEDSVTTRTYESDGSRAKITQDGAPKETTVERDGNGQTIVQRSDGNSSIVVQRSGPDGASDEDVDEMLEDMRQHHADGPFRRFLDRKLGN